MHIARDWYLRKKKHREKLLFLSIINKVCFHFLCRHYGEIRANVKRNDDDKKRCAHSFQDEGALIIILFVYAAFYVSSFR